MLGGHWERESGNSDVAQTLGGDAYIVEDGFSSAKRTPAALANVSSGMSQLPRRERAHRGEQTLLR